MALASLPLPQCPLRRILGEFLTISTSLPASSTQTSPQGTAWTRVKGRVLES